MASISVSLQGSALDLGADGVEAFRRRLRD